MKIRLLLFLAVALMCDVSLYAEIGGAADVPTQITDKDKIFNR